MIDHIEIGPLTKYDAFRVNRDLTMNLEIWFKIDTKVYYFEIASPQTIQALKRFNSLLTTVKSCHAPTI